MIIYGGYVYILSNSHHTVFYVGATASLAGRLKQHKAKVNPKSFTARYNIEKLLYYEFHSDIEDAFERETKIKKYSRGKKVALIRSLNPEMKDLSFEVRFC